MSIKKAYIFGASRFGEEVYYRLKKYYDIIGFIDNDKNKWGKEFCTKKVFPVEILLENNYKVFIASNWMNEIEQQLENLSYRNYEKIYSVQYCDLYVERIIKQKCIEINNNEKQNLKRILILRMGKNNPFVKFCGEALNSTSNVQLYITQVSDEKNFDCDYIRINIDNFKELKQLLLYINKFDVINIQSIDPIYEIVIDTIRDKCDKLVTTIYGSDFHLATKLEIDKQEKIFSMSDKITFANPVMIDEFIERYGERYREKCLLKVFGLPIIDIIEKKQIKGIDIDRIKNEFKIPKDKIIVNIGHSAGKNDNHLEIIEFIQKFKDLIFCIVPLTYSGDEEYKESIKKSLVKNNMEFLILDKYLTNEEIAKIKIIIDIHINLLNSDNFSGWMQECLYAGSVVIKGEWLKYPMLCDDNIVSIKEISEINEKLSYCIENLDYLKKLSYKNRNIIKKISGCENCKKEWINLFLYMK